MIIIIEGADSAGKTTTAQYLHEQFDLPLKHFGGPPESVEEIEGRLKLLSSDGIFDRCPLISEQVYGPIFRGGCYLSEEIINEYSEMLRKRLHCIIYCRPDVITEGIPQKDWKSKKECRQLEKKRQTVIDSYDKVMAGVDLNVFLFNRNESDLCVVSTYISEIIQKYTSGE
jgi:hypothetical protein